MMDRGKLVFVTGAARSGKSSFAEKRAAELGGQVTYIATCVPGDEEMEERVACHQARRPGEWRTVEEALDPAAVIRRHDGPGRLFLLDCVTLLVTNLLLQPEHPMAEEQILDKIAELAQISQESVGHVIIVSNEVGWGIVPGDPLSRMWRDIVGRANQILADRSDETWLTVSGIPIELKSLGRGV